MYSHTLHSLNLFFMSWQQGHCFLRLFLFSAFSYGLFVLDTHGTKHVSIVSNNIVWVFLMFILLRYVLCLSYIFSIVLIIFFLFISNQCGKCGFICAVSAARIFFRALDIERDSGKKCCQAEKI